MTLGLQRLCVRPYLGYGISMRFHGRTYMGYGIDMRFRVRP